MAGEHSNFVSMLEEQYEASQRWAHDHPREAVQSYQTMLAGGQYLSTRPSEVAKDILDQQQMVQAQAELNLYSLKQQQAIQAQNSLSMNNAAYYAQQRMMRDYADMNPFTTGPAYNQNLTQAEMLDQHVRIMNLNNMNPYIASSMSMQGMRENMADAQYMTSARYGVYRNPIVGGQPVPTAGPTGGTGFIQDLATMFNARSIPLYEDPFEARFRARRRMSNLYESHAAGGVDFAALAAGVTAGFAVGGIPGAALGTLVHPVTSYMTDRYLERRGHAQRVQDITKDFITTGPDVSALGVGLSNRSSAQAVSDLRKYAAESPFFNLQDIDAILQQSSEAGMMNFVGRKEDIVRAVKQQAEMLHVFMRITGDPDLKSAFEQMARYQTMGIAAGNQATMLNNINAFARLAGVGVNKMMETSAAAGAQQALQIGAAPVLGMEVGAMSAGAAKVIQQRNLLNPLQLAMRGGESGMAQNMAANLISEIHGGLGRFGSAFVTRKNGVMSVDTDMLNRYISGEVSAKEMFDLSISNFREGGKDYATQYVREREDLVAEMESKMTPAQQIMFARRQIDDIVERGGGLISRQEALQSKYGSNWKNMQLLMGRENIEAQRQQQRVQYNKYIMAEELQAKTANSWYMRLLTGTASAYNSTMEWFLQPIEEWSAERDQMKEMKATGQEYVESDSYRLSQEAEQTARNLYSAERTKRGATTALEKRSMNEDFEDYARSAGVDVDTALKGLQFNKEVFSTLNDKKARSRYIEERENLRKSIFALDKEKMDDVIEKTRSKIQGKWSPEDLRGDELKNLIDESIKETFTDQGRYNPFSKITEEQRQKAYHSIAVSAWDRIADKKESLFNEASVNAMENYRNLAENQKVDVEIYKKRSQEEAQKYLKEAGFTELASKTDSGWWNSLFGSTKKKMNAALQEAALAYGGDAEGFEAALRAATGKGGGDSLKRVLESQGKEKLLPQFETLADVIESDVEKGLTSTQSQKLQAAGISLAIGTGARSEYLKGSYRLPTGLQGTAAEEASRMQRDMDMLSKELERMGAEGSDDVAGMGVLRNQIANLEKKRKVELETLFEQMAHGFISLMRAGAFK